jgi:hypothetical protein
MDEGWTGAEIQECCRKADNLRISLEKSAQYIIPVSVSARDVVEKLQKTCTDKYLSASYPGKYQGRKGSRINPVAELLESGGRAFES